MKIPPKKSFAVGLGFRAQCSNIRIRDTRVFDSTGTNVCCRSGIAVLESDHVWIERNYLTEGLRLGAGGVGDKLIIQNNIVEDANDNAITISTATYSAQTINYIIRDNIVRAAKGGAIYIGDDGFGLKDPPDPSITESKIVCRNILVDGNLLLGPLEKDQCFVVVHLANYTERLHIVNNVMVNAGSATGTQGVNVSIQNTRFGRKGFDFLIAHNTIDGKLGCGICVGSLERVRIVQNQLSNGISDSYGIKIGGDGDTESVLDFECGL
jgi:Right handed beta helix region